MEWYLWALIIALLLAFAFIKVKAVGAFFAWQKKRRDAAAARAEEQESV